MRLVNIIILISGHWCVSGQAPSRREWVDTVLHDGGGSHIYGFPSYDETHYILDSFSQWNPLFTRRMLTGISVKCRPLWAYWLSGSGIWHEASEVREYLDGLSRELIASILEEESELIEECSSSSSSSVNTTEQFMASLAAYQQRRSSHNGNTKNKSAAWPNAYYYGRSLFTSLHHAREPTSLTTPFYAYLRVLEDLNTQLVAARGSSLLRAGGGTSSSSFSNVSSASTKREDRIVAALIAQREILWIPFVNPDGYIDIADGADSNIRKNRRITCDKKKSVDRRSSQMSSLLQRFLPPQRTPNINLQDQQLPDYHEGVDINRNYDDHFVQAHNPCDPEEYEGPHAFSEPETRAVRRVAQLFRPQTALNFHSYGDLWTHPFNCCPDKKLNHTEYQVFRELHDSLNITLFGSAPMLPVLGYTTTGEADDYLLSKIGIISMSPEVGPEAGGFYPEESMRRAIHQDNFPRILSVVSKAGPEFSALLAAEHCGGSSMSAVDSDDGEKQHTWIITLFNSGLSRMPRGRVILQFGTAEVQRSAEEVTMNLGYYAGNQLDFEGTRTTSGILKDPKEFQSSLPKSNKPSHIRYQNGTEATLDEGDGWIRFAIDSTESRHRQEIALAFANVALPKIIHICFVPDRMNHNTSALGRRGIQDVLCTCGYLRHQSDSNACPFDRTALLLGPELFDGHPCQSVVSKAL